MAVHDRLIAAPGVAPGTGYAHAVTASGRFAFISGQVALDATGRLVGAGDLAAQTRQALGNLHGVLLALGAGWPDVARFTWYVLDATAAQTIRDVRDELIGPALAGRANPASSLVQVAALVRPEFLIEVEAVAAVPG